MLFCYLPRHLPICRKTRSAQTTGFFPQKKSQYCTTSVVCYRPQKHFRMLRLWSKIFKKYFSFPNFSSKCSFNFGFAAFLGKSMTNGSFKVCCCLCHHKWARLWTSFKLKLNLGESLNGLETVLRKLPC